ncbi:hypothetical protein OPV22_005736 [Ensete ventricosum]|uniref:Uncharacterized protein n=1 Tax=Ensete ventricosum TaxID=4639 RepID=A0AAV8RDI6_ENSVE|nr:hypothetical protein OPV22_005736 [Ensete ventricosum]
MNKRNPLEWLGAGRPTAATAAEEEIIAGPTYPRYAIDLKELWSQKGKGKSRQSRANSFDPPRSHLLLSKTSFGHPGISLLSLLAWVFDEGFLRSEEGFLLR